MKQRSSAPMKPRRNKLQSSPVLQKRLRSVTARNLVTLCLMLALASIASLAHAADIGTVEGQTAHGVMELLYGNGYVYWDGTAMNGSTIGSALTFAGGGSSATFIGGSGNDTFYAGTGSSTFVGGAGADIFAIPVGANNTGSHYIVTDFQTTTDSLYILGGIFSAGYLVANASGGPGNVTLTMSNGARVTFPNLTSASQLNGRISVQNSSDLPTVNSGPPVAATSANSATAYGVYGITGQQGTYVTPVGDLVYGTPLSQTIVAGDSVSGLAIKSALDGVGVQTAVGDTLLCKAGSLALTSSGGSFTLFGTINGQTVQGGTNTHTITGGAGNDTLIAGAGNDTLTGGPGIDILTGGLGTNRFVDTATNLNLDTITDLKIGDTIVITGVRFTALRYNGTNGGLQLDTGSDGSFATSIKLSTGLVGNFLATPSDAGGAASTTVSLTQVPAASPSLQFFSYNPGNGAAQVSIKGGANLLFRLVEAAHLDFTNPVLDPIPLTGATVGTLSGNAVTTDGSGNATVQFNLGIAKNAAFLRAKTVP